MTRSFLKELKLPSFIWGEAVHHSIYVLNHLSTRVLNGRTPYEMWSGKKPNLAHIKVFGCTAYMKIPMVHVKKLDDRSTLVVYLEREPGTKGNPLYDPKTVVVHVSRDVVVQENDLWPWEQNKESDVSFPGHFTVINSLSDADDNTETEYGQSTPLQSPAVGTTKSSAEKTDVSSGTSSEPRRFRPWASCTMRLR